MTTAGTDEHPEVDELAALAEGLLAPERAADIRGHLAQCALCADVRDSLAEVRDLLGTLPGPPRMPDEVAARIDAALAAEVLLRGQEPRTADAPQSPSHGIAAAPTAFSDSAAVRGPAGPRTPGRHVSRETSPSSDRPGARPGGSTGPGRPSRSSRRRWRVLTAVAGVAVVGLGGVLAYDLSSQGNGHPTAGGARTTAVGTFSGEALPAKVHELLGGASPQARPNTATAGTNSPFASKPPVVPACVLKAAGLPGVPALASARGTYEGHTSYLVVIPDAATPRTRVDAFVVDAACAAPGAPAGAKGTVLTHRTYDRG